MGSTSYEEMLCGFLRGWFLGSGWCVGVGVQMQRSSSMCSSERGYTPKTVIVNQLTRWL